MLVVLKIVVYPYWGLWKQYVDEGNSNLIILIFEPSLLSPIPRFLKRGFLEFPFARGKIKLDRYPISMHQSKYQYSFLVRKNSSIPNAEFVSPCYLVEDRGEILKQVSWMRDCDRKTSSIFVGMIVICWGKFGRSVACVPILSVCNKCDSEHREVCGDSHFRRTDMCSDTEEEGR